MAVTSGNYISESVIKRALHISHSDYDSEISDCIRGTEARINTILGEHTTTPITKDNDIEQIAVAMCVARFDQTYRENLTPDIYNSARAKEKYAIEDLQNYINHNYAGRSKWAKVEVKRVDPSNGKSNLITNIFD